MTPGDLFWVEMPVAGGHAQAGRRPAIIVQSTAASEQLPTVIVVPLTTQQDALRFPGTLLIQPAKRTGLKRPSVALVFQITVIDRSFLGSQLGSVSAEDMQEIWTAFDQITDRSSGVAE